MRICGLVGFINSGKGTVGQILHDRFGFIQESFAKPVKDSVSAIFGWSRHLLEGDTKESRDFRETVDPWWTEKFEYTVTPRLMLQKFGTEAVRNGIHQDIWIASLEQRIHKSLPTVITDVRFPNEIESIRRMGGYIVWVQKGNLPEWYDYAFSLNAQHRDGMKHHPQVMVGYPDIHYSEWAWIGEHCDFEVYNDGTLNDLNAAVDELITESYIEDAFRTGVL